MALPSGKRHNTISACIISRHEISCHIFTAVVLYYLRFPFVAGAIIIELFLM